MKKIVYLVFIFSFFFSGSTSIFAGGDYWTSKSLPSDGSTRSIISRHLSDTELFTAEACMFPVASCYSAKKYDSVTDTWSDIPQNSLDPYKTSTGLWTAINGKIYVVGGLNCAHLHCSSIFGSDYLFEYDPQTQTWSEKARLITGQYMPKSFVVNGKLYIMHGSVNPFSYGGAIKYVLEEYNPVTNKWISKGIPPMKDNMGWATFQNLIDYNYAIIGSKVYLMTGYLQSLMAGLDSSSFSNFNWEYDTSNDTWTKKKFPDLFNAHSFYYCAVGDKIYILNSIRYYNQNQSGAAEYFHFLKMYDPTTDTWTDKTASARSLYNISIIPLNGKIYTFGGVDSPSSNMFDGRYNSLINEFYDTKTDTWKLFANKLHNEIVGMPFNGSGSLSLVSLKNKIYVSPYILFPKILPILMNILS